MTESKTTPRCTHGSPELDEDAKKLKAMGGDPASVRMYLTMRGYMQPSPKSRRRDSDDELEELLNGLGAYSGVTYLKDITGDGENWSAG